MVWARRWRQAAEDCSGSENQGLTRREIREIKLPTDAPTELNLDMRELETAVFFGLSKTVMLLAGSIAEIQRHPRKDERRPSLRQLVEQARKERPSGAEGHPQKLDRTDRVQTQVPSEGGTSMSHNKCPQLPAAQFGPAPGKMRMGFRHVDSLEPRWFFGTKSFSETTIGAEA